MRFPSGRDTSGSGGILVIVSGTRDVHAGMTGHRTVCSDDLAWKEGDMGYLVVIEPTERGYSAFVPDLEGCVATGRTRDQVERQIRAVIEFHLAGLRSAGCEPPPPNASATTVQVWDAGRPGKESSPAR